MAFEFYMLGCVGKSANDMKLRLNCRDFLRHRVCRDIILCSCGHISKMIQDNAASNRKVEAHPIRFKSSN